MSDDTYNGWSNRETWAANLHWSSNEGDYELIREWAEYLAGPVPNWYTKDEAVADLAERLQKYAEEIYGMVVGNDYGLTGDRPAVLFVSDVGSLWRIDFHEIAEHWIADVIADREYEKAEAGSAAAAVAAAWLIVLVAALLVLGGVA
ncbi:MAG: hypothetical protein DWQ40_00280 [Actinobacteria bacterium]|nr:MAG: hypothetical protein DWQ40_00280 [Actinomycetota bacterium]REK35593.1 MAG: hypothetical protein DWQ20_06105 [Actinomycetota bacterium]